MGFLFEQNVRGEYPSERAGPTPRLTLPYRCSTAL
jgi:hypothetical protein